MSIFPRGDFADAPNEVRFKIRRGPAHLWSVRNTVLLNGEPGVETNVGAPDKFKIGDGVTPWNDLEYYMTADAITTLVQTLIAASPGGGGGGTGDVTSQELIDHINSLTPHPNYDDGTSFILRYENAKV